MQYGSGVFVLVCGVTIALSSWVARFSMNPDGVSYLDMADRLLKGDLHTLIHPYWSPLYPSLLAIALKVCTPAPSMEAVVVHLLNCLIGWAALGSFTFFVRQRTDRSAVTTAFAYALFLWGTCELIGLSNVTPDLCVAALVFWIAGLASRLAQGRGNRRTSIWLGIALSTGYFAKATLLPLGIALLVLLAIPRAVARWVPSIRVIASLASDTEPS